MASIKSKLLTITFVASSLEDLVKEAKEFIASNDKLGMVDGIEVNISVVPTEAPKTAEVATTDHKTHTMPKCTHGEMNHLKGTSKKTGKPYDGFYCPESVISEQCPPSYPPVKKQLTADRKVDWESQSENI